MRDFFFLLLIAVVSYCLGAVNGAIIISRYIYGKDIREFGSGNAGLTNMHRVFGLPAAGMVFAVDVLKSVIAILFSGWLFGLAGYENIGKLFAGFCLILGHMFPAYYDFKGGKGILCGAVMVALLDWRIFLILVAVFAAVVIVTRYVSLGSIVAALLLTVLVPIFLRDWLAFWVTFIIAGSVIGKHYQNILRLLSGKESKISFGSKRSNQDQ